MAGAGAFRFCHTGPVVSKSENSHTRLKIGKNRFWLTVIEDDTAVHAVCIAGIPEAPSHSAFSSGFSFHLIFLFILLAVQHFRCSSRRQHSPPQRPAVLVSRACAVRHRATGLRGQVSMRHFPFVSDGSNFSRTTFGLADRDEVR